MSVLVFHFWKEGHKSDILYSVYGKSTSKMKKGLKEKKHLQVLLLLQSMEDINISMSN